MVLAPSTADRLLARAAELLGWQGALLASEVANYELLNALEAGGARREAPWTPLDAPSRQPACLVCGLLKSL